MELLHSVSNMDLGRSLQCRMAYSAASCVLVFCFVAFSQADPPPINTAAARPADIKMLTEANWQTVLKSDEEWLVMFKADWCPDASPGLAGRFQANMLPTIYHVKRNEYRRYPGLMSRKGLEDFVYDMQWQAATPVPKYFSPGSPHMRIVQEFYMLSGRALRVHDYFVKVHKLPAWSVYAMFVLAVILGGFFIGLGFVFVVDGLGWLLSRREANRGGAEDRRRVGASKKVDGNTSNAAASSDRQSSAANDGVDSTHQTHAASSKSTADAKSTGSRLPSKPASRAGSAHEEVVTKPTVAEKIKRENYAEGTLAEEESASSAADSDSIDKSSNASGRDELVVNGDGALNGEGVDTEEDTTELVPPPTKPRKQRRKNAGQHDISVTSAGGDTASTISVIGSEPASSESSYNLRPRRRRREE